MFFFQYNSPTKDMNQLLATKVTLYNMKIMLSLTYALKVATYI